MAYEGSMTVPSLVLGFTNTPCDPDCAKIVATTDVYTRTCT